MRIVMIFVLPVMVIVALFLLTNANPVRSKYDGAIKYISIQPDSVLVRNKLNHGGLNYSPERVIDSNFTTGWAPGNSFLDPRIQQNEIMFIFRNPKKLSRIVLFSGNNSFIPENPGQKYLRAKSFDITLNGTKLTSPSIYEERESTIFDVPTDTLIKSIAFRATDFFWGYGRYNYLVTEVQFLYQVPVNVDTIKLKFDH